jgi:hypothetical protein
MSLKIRRRPGFVEIVGRMKVLEKDDVPTSRRLVFDGIVRGADIRFYLEGVLLEKKLRRIKSP